MKQILGRFLLQPNKDFPADCEMLDYAQTNLHVVSILGNLAGDKAVLWGCTPTGGGTQRAEGYVFLRTKDHPEGEVLYWEGGHDDGRHVPAAGDDSRHGRRLRLPAGIRRAVARPGRRF